MFDKEDVPMVTLISQTITPKFCNLVKDRIIYAQSTIVFPFLSEQYKLSNILGSVTFFDSPKYCAKSTQNIVFCANYTFLSTQIFFL